VFCTDIDGDGYVDVVTANKDDGSTTLYYNDLGTNNHSVPAGNNNSGTLPRSLGPHCLVHLSSHASSSGAAATAESGWVGVFVDQAQNAPESLFVADVNGDGKQDIVVANTGANNTRWYTTTTNDYTWQGRTVGNVTSTSSTSLMHHRTISHARTTRTDITSSRPCNRPHLRVCP
jgi:hypothetical protein